MTDDAADNEPSAESLAEMPEVDLFLGFSDLHHLVPELARRGLIDDPVAAHPGVRQFLGETAMLVLSALLLGTAAAALFLSHATDWLELRIGPAALFDPQVILFIACVTVGLILTAGLYPAFVQSAFDPVTAFRNMKAPTVRGFSLRKSLVVVQFVISQVLIIGTLVVAYQMDFFKNQDLGFKKDAIVSFFLPDRNKREVLLQQLMAGLFGYGLRSLGAAGAPTGSTGHAAAALVGGGVVFALALVLPGLVYLRGACSVYLAMRSSAD